jgi:hypothetical protein
VWDCVDQLSDAARAQPGHGGKLPEGVPCLLRGKQRHTVGLLRQGNLLRGLLHVGQHVVGDLVHGASDRDVWGGRPHGPEDGGHECYGVKGEDGGQALEQEEGWEPMALLEVGEVLGRELAAQQLCTALCHLVLGQTLSLTGLPQELTEGVCHL